VRLLSSFSLLLCVGCMGANVASDAELEGGQAAGRVEICDGQTLAELAHAKTLSASCKDGVAAYLPAASDNFTGRVMVLGTEAQPDGSLRVFLAGTDADGVALPASAYARVTVSPVSPVAQDSATPPGPWAVTPFGQLSADVLSLGLVNDRSASMSSPDLLVVERVQKTLFNLLPPFYEGELTLFSSEVLVKQPFTTDHAKLLGAVEGDDGIDPELTALYDGMGNALDSLTGRSRPARVLMVSTDGLENASVAYKKQEIVKAIADDHVFVVMLGALFADVSELKSLAGPRGVYFYTPLYADPLFADPHGKVTDLLAALTQGVALDIPPAVAAERPLRLDLDAASVEID